MPILSAYFLCSILQIEPASADRGAFWEQWGDGKAEVNGYSLRLSRYGQPRQGALVLIYVTEDMADSMRVKADPGKHPPSDVYPVLKLNAIRKFQTGIYDYSTMTSVFIRVDNRSAGGGPLRKISFSSQEWCGHVYHQVLPQESPGRPGQQLLSSSHSYFDGEADDQRNIDWPAGALAEDELPIRLRSFAGQPDLLAPGGRVELPLLRSLLRVRLLHLPLAVGQVIIERGVGSESRETPAGKFQLFTYVVSILGESAAGGGPAKVVDRAIYHIESTPPHRLIHYRWDSGEEATLLGSRRLAYWQVNQNGQEALLQELGLLPLQSPWLASPKQRAATASHPR